MVAQKRQDVPAVAYYRMSSDRQELSIPQQVQAVERYAAENGYRILRDYRDEGISGDDTAKRVEFKRLVLDATRGDFRAVLAWDQDRLGRFDPIEAGYWLTPLRDAGVSIVTVNQGVIDLDDFAGQIVYSVTQAAKHAFLKDLARNATRGALSAASAGRWIGGDPPLGYRIDPASRRLVIDEEEAAIVRRIFKAYDEGHSLRDIAESLNRDGILPTTKRRRPDHPRAVSLWRANVIGYLLINEAYVGTYRWNNRQRGKYVRVRGGEVSTVRRGERKARNWSDAVMIPNAHEPLVSREVFDRIRAKLTRNRGATSPAREDLKPLTGLCRCGYCGERMGYTAQGVTDMRSPNRVLVCQSLLHYGAAHCGRRTVREDVLLPTIVGVVSDRLTAPENAQRLRSALERLCRDKSAPKELDRLKREAVKLEDDIAKARRRVVEVDADMLGIVQEHLRDLRRRHEEATARLRDLEWRAGAGAQDIEATVSRAMAAAARIADRLSGTDPRRLREAMRETIEQVEVFSDATATGRRKLWRLSRGRIILRSEVAQSCPTLLAASDKTALEFGPDDVARYAA